MKIFFSGTESLVYANILFSNGGRRFLVSFYRIQKIKNYQKFQQVEYLLDSGGFTARKNGVFIDVKQYAQFINEFKPVYAFNLDVQDRKESMKNQEYLEKNTQTYIIPVVHLDDYFADRDFVDFYLNYPFIAAGGMVTRHFSTAYKMDFLEYLFSHTSKEQKIHGLGIGQSSFLCKFPFYSIDNTSWLSSARYLGFSREELAQKKTLDYKKRTAILARQWLSYEDYYTRYWEAKGIVWKN